uniref:Ly6/neurotoxin 1 n=1 Tax=Sciurus vulgaris TaxID=55149 RepID=A0A8D2DVE5_SCIVU
MAPLLALFLAALVGLPLAQALDCHVCAYNGDNCFNPMRCPAMVTYCMTTRTYYTPYKMKVSKSCVPSCFETVCSPGPAVPPVQGLWRLLPRVQLPARLHPLRHHRYP